MTTLLLILTPLLLLGLISIVGMAFSFLIWWLRKEDEE